jgi:hypothetical protein
VISRPDKWTLVVAVLGVSILFVPIPVITQLVGLPLVVYACYRYWGRDDLGADSWGAGAFWTRLAGDVVYESGPLDATDGSDESDATDESGASGATDGSDGSRG